MRIQDKNHIVISGWMYRLGLSSIIEVIAFAAIYGFSQDNSSEFKGSITFIQDFLMCSRPTAIKVMKNLENKGLITKRQTNDNGIVLNRYSANLEVVNSLNYPQLNDLTTPSKTDLPHIYKDNNESNNSNNSPITNSPIITLEESRITSNTPKENDQPTIFGDKIPQEKVLDENEVIQSIMAYWNTETKFIKIRSIEGKRRKMLIARLKEEGTNNVIKAIQTANQSSFLTEKWKMTFDWFVMPSNFTKIVEGNYNNDYGNHTSRPTDSQLLGAAIRNSWGPGGNPFD